MISNKIIGGLFVVGGIGTATYFLLKKNKTSKQLSSLDNTPTNLYNKAESERCVNYILTTDWDNVFKRDPQFVKDCNNLQGKSELTESLVDQNVMLLNNDKSPNTCLELDWFIKLATADIAKGGQKFSIQERDNAQEKFNRFSCRDKIETKRTNELISTETKSAIEAEKTIGKRSLAEQNIYIGLGAVALLTGLYIVIKK